MILQATNINDITFRTMDVVLITGGVISILTSFLWQRFQTKSNEKDIEILTVEVSKLEKLIERHGETTGEFKDKIFGKLDEQRKDIHNLSDNINEFKIEILKELKK